MRAYKFATTPPMEPVVIIADGMLQEHPVDEDAKLTIPKLTLTMPPQGEGGALKEAAKLMAAADSLVIIADRAARSQEGEIGRASWREGVESGGLAADS